mgnify:CR=1 FL=1
MANEENQLSTDQASIEGVTNDIVLHSEAQNSTPVSNPNRDQENGSVNCDTEGISSNQLEGQLIQSVPNEVATDLVESDPEETQKKIKKENYKNGKCNKTFCRKC